MHGIKTKGVSLKQLRAQRGHLPAWIREGTEPLPHATFVDCIENELDATGWDISDQSYAVANEGTNMVAVFAITSKDTMLTAPAGCRWVLGVVRGDSRRVRPRWYLGLTGANKASTWLVVLRHSPPLAHTRTVEEAVPEVKAGVAWFTKEIPGAARAVAKLRQREVSHQQMSYILMRAAVEPSTASRAMPLARVREVWEMFDERAHEDHPTAWLLLTTYGEVAAAGPPVTQLPQMCDFAETMFAIFKNK